MWADAWALKAKGLKHFDKDLFNEIGVGAWTILIFNNLK